VRENCCGRQERVFRCLKGIDLRVRPIRHRTEPRVRAHVCLCLLACYVDGTCGRRSDPCSSRRSSSRRLARRAPRSHPRSRRPRSRARRPSGARRTGSPSTTFATLLATLGTRCRTSCRMTADPTTARFQQLKDNDPSDPPRSGSVRQTLWPREGGPFGTQVLVARGAQGVRRIHYFSSQRSRNRGMRSGTHTQFWTFRLITANSAV
jgi:hypothetical protein